MKISFKIPALVILFSAIFFVFFEGKTSGHVLPGPGTVVPVDDARAIQLLHALRDKELEGDPQQRNLAAQNLNLITDEIIRRTFQAMGRKGDIRDTGQLNVFVDNWRNFILESQYRAEDLWRGLLHIAANGVELPNQNIPPLICDYLRNSTVFQGLQPREATDLLQTGIQRRAGTLEEFLVTVQCDPEVNQNFEIFMQSFEAGGGWDTFEKLLQPQNNIFGLIELANQELENQKRVEELADVQEVNSGSGYLGRRQCLSFGQSGQ